MDEMTVAVEPASAYYIRQVQWKLAAGIYQTNPAACFCGSTEAHAVTERDRYGLPHAMQMCKTCGVLYANPRLTDASYAEFYATEYRAIYRTEEDSAEEDFARGAEHAQALKTYLDDTRAHRPSVVFDIGCNAGGWLKPFFDAGCTVHGVDYGPERVAFGQEKGLPLEVGSIETLEIMGLQADLVIMNHVLEHATNIEDTLRRVRGLLTETGLLYVALPGLFASDLHSLFQQAHPWQFTAETLTYVMECCGFEEVRADHTITSLWRKTDSYRPKTKYPSEQFIRDIGLYLFRRGTRYIPKVRSGCKFSLVDRQAAVRSAMARKLPTCRTVVNRHAGQSAIVIGGGPSVDGYVEKIRAMQQAGSPLISIERMNPWCQQHGLTPDYLVTMDASDDVLEAFATLTPGVTYLTSSQCQPAVFDRLTGETVYLVHTSEHDLPTDDLFGVHDHCDIVNGAGSVTLCSLSLAMLMGMRTIHLFGFDCHVSDGSYAAGIAGVGAQEEVVGVKVEGRAFQTTTAYLCFAQQFFEVQHIGKRDGLLEAVHVYGDSLVTAMSVQPIGGDR